MTNCDICNIETPNYSICDACSKKPIGYVSSILNKYGDTENVKRDVKILNEILSRQGTSLFIDVIAEHVGTCAVKFKFHSSDSIMIMISLVDELEAAIKERI